MIEPSNIHRGINAEGFIELLKLLLVEANRIPRTVDKARARHPSPEPGSWGRKAGPGSKSCRRPCKQRQCEVVPVRSHCAVARPLRLQAADRTHGVHRLGIKIPHIFWKQYP